MRAQHWVVNEKHFQRSGLKVRLQWEVHSNPSSASSCFNLGAHTVSLIRISLLIALFVHC